MLGKPNLKLPLAASYNTRGTDGFGNVITSGLDQRKINSLYDLVKNSITGKATLYLCKRPGYADSGNSYGTTGQVAYLVGFKTANTSLAASQAWVYSKNGNDNRVSDTSTNTTVLTSSAYFPAFIDKTAISGTENVILQLRDPTNNNQRVYYGTAIGSWTEITDSEFTTPAAGGTIRGKMEFLDGYAFYLDSSSRINNSDINSIANWSAAQYITKQIKQDSSTALARFGKLILAFGEQTVEVFQSAGTPTGSPLVTIPSLSQDVGMPSLTAGGHYYANCNGKMYLYAREGGSRLGLGIFAYNGQTFERVSNAAIDSILNSLAFSTSENIFSVNSSTVNGRNFVSIALDPVTAATQRWLVYFPDWKEWFEWNSTVISPVSNGTHNLGVGANQHKIYTINSGTETWQDAGTNYTWTHQFQLPSNDNERQFMPYMALKGDTARSAQSISVEFSDDDYQNFSTARTIDMTKPEKSLFRCGSYKGSRVVRLSHTGNTEVRLSEFLARIE